MATNSAVRPSGAPGAHGSVAAASGAEGARRVLAVLQAFSPRHHTLTARDLAESTGIPLPSMYRYIALLRETGLLVGDERGAYHLSARLISLARAAEAAESIIEVADPVMRDLVQRVRRDGDPRPVDRPGPGVRAPGRVGASPARHVRAGPAAADRARRQRAGAARRAAAAAAARLPGAARGGGPAGGRAPEERIAAETAERGWATSEEEIDRGVWAASAAVTDGRSTVAALTVPSPLVRSPAAIQERLLGQVCRAAQQVSDLLRDAERS